MTARPAISPVRFAGASGYSVLQAVREWEKTKAPYRGKKTAAVIAELIAEERREQLSAGYVDRLEEA